MTQQAPQRTATKKHHTRRNIVLAVIAVIVIAAVALVLLLPRGPHKAIANETTRAIENTQIGQTVDRIVPQNRLISTMVTPASATWWRSMAYYVAQFDLVKLPYAKLDNPTELGLVTLYSTNSDYNSPFFLATPAVVLTYKNDAAAKQAQASIFSVSNDATAYGVYQLGSSLIMLPGNSIAEDLLTVKKYVQAKNPQAVTQAYWHIDWNNLNDYMHSVQTASYRSTYDKVLGYVGANASGVDAYWDGTSTDGKTWQGEVNTTDDTTAFTPQKFDPTKLIAAIASSSEDKVFVDKNGDVASYGITIPHQAAILNHLAISTPTTAVGAYTDPSTLKTDKAKKTTDQNTITIKFDPNRWFQYMSRDVSNVYYFFYYQTLTVKLDNNSNDMNLTFSQPNLPTS